MSLFAELGIRSLRYPALWERISPDAPEVADFRWTDERLPEIRRLGMNPVVTLCHHGSGPHYTSLIDPSFAPGLARHAAAVAARYPWVQDWTPVNEPLTTARFSALYGYWYPHTKDEGLFWTALLNEIDATRLSMREIRKVNPAARLIQTDDLGYCHATPPLQCEAEYQNERRWMGWDLLCGMVVPGHALWDRLIAFGLEDRLRIIAADPCPPDIIGINHYLASERLLDHRVELHPDRALADRETGECSGLSFVDVDAVRNRREAVLGLPTLVEQAWERYGIPIAITECHNGATREEQVRWLVDVWNWMEGLRARDVDVRAVTVWSLLGSHDWNRMVTRFIGHYETGVFDCRSGSPRPTLLAPVLKDLADGREPSHPCLHAPGWWRREIDRGSPGGCRFELKVGPHAIGAPAPIVIVGDDGPLTQLAVDACEVRAIYYVRAGADALRIVDAAKPWAVLDARDHDDLCGFGTATTGDCSVIPLIEACAAQELPCAVFTHHLSSAAVDHASAVAGLLLVRTSGVFLPWQTEARPVALLDALDRHAPVQVDPAVRWEFVYGPDLVDGVLDLLLDGCEGAVSFLPLEPWSEADFADALAVVADRDPQLIELSGAGVPVAAENAVALTLLPPGETTLERFVREARAARGGALVTLPSDDEAEWLEAAE